MPRSSSPKTPNHLAKIPGQRSFDAQALSMIMALASELTVTRARLDTCERLLVKAGVLEADAFDNFDPDPTAQTERDDLRTRSMKKIFRSMIEASEADLASLDPET